MSNLAHITVPGLSIVIRGLEYHEDASAGCATVAHFESITVNQSIILTYEELTELSAPIVTRIWAVLDVAASAAWLDWQREAADLRAWLRLRRN